MNILVRAPNWIGDQILAGSFFYALRQMYPQAYIVSVCGTWVSSIQFHPWIDEVCVLPNSSNEFLGPWKALEKVAYSLKKKRSWDLGLLLSTGFSEAWLFYRAGVLRRRGYPTNGRGFLLHEKVETEVSGVVHRSESYLKLLTQKKEVFSGWTQSFLEAFDPELAWPGAWEPPGESYWVLAPGSQASSRRWPVESFALLMYLMHQKTGWSVLLVGGAEDVVWGKVLEKVGGGKVFNWINRGPVASYWKVLQKAKVCVCNDSGLAHLASLCGASVQVIWGAGDPKRTLPLSLKKVFLSMNPVSCWPCEKNTCFEKPALQCLKGMNVSRIFEDIERSGVLDG